MPRNVGRTTFMCQQCGADSPKWVGRCPSCGEWNSFLKIPVKDSISIALGRTSPSAPPRELSTISYEESPRIVLSSAELNRVLGGGIVPGSLVLITGEPGIGKSTLLLQLAESVAQRGKVAYVSGEESPQQVKLRAERLGIKGHGIYFIWETQLEEILGHLTTLSPTLTIVDSIQTLYSNEVASAPGTVTQIRECTLRLMQWFKQKGTPMVLAGHVTKDGIVAGPRVLEHMVDVVLYLEGDTLGPYRMLRGEKNRFGSTHEIGFFRMTKNGLEEVSDPSRLFLAQRQQGVAGSTVVPILEGTRPLLVEVQALTTPTIYPVPRRVANGIDFNRLLLILAVLGKREGVSLSHQDVIVSVAGGIRVVEPAADLAMALALISSLKGIPLPSDLVTLGEVGLTGEIRGIHQAEQRLAEAAKLGFSRCILPMALNSEIKDNIPITPLWVSTLDEAIKKAFPKTRNGSGFKPEEFRPYS